MVLFFMFMKYINSSKMAYFWTDQKTPICENCNFAVIYLFIFFHWHWSQNEPPSIKTVIMLQFRKFVNLLFTVWKHIFTFHCLDFIIIKCWHYGSLPSKYSMIVFSPFLKVFVLHTSSMKFLNFSSWHVQVYSNIVFLLFGNLF